MDPVVKALLDQSGQLFSKRGSILSLWQEIAEHFYPERADFTTLRSEGEDLAGDLMTSYPILARRDLGNAFGAMLRPSAKDWFRMRTNAGEKEGLEERQWLEWATGFMKRTMYERGANFARATKEADMDFAAFGQAALSAELNRLGNSLLYRCWHLRDLAWAENSEGKVDTVYRKWKPTARTLITHFPGACHPDVVKMSETRPFEEVDVQHCMLPAEVFMSLPGAKRVLQPYVSAFLDEKHQCVLQAIGSWSPYYIIPRWATVSGSQYGHSPATVAALPDARLIQQLTRVLLTAGEKAVDPPMLAVREALRSDVSIYAGGITWVAQEYDERLGEALRPLTQDKTGINFGMEMGQDLRTQLADAFYLSKLNLPPTTGREMTAYEVGQRIQEFIRNTLPLFEPLEHEYNGQLCDATFEIILRNTPEFRDSIPESLRGKEIVFQFESPLREAIEKVKIGQFNEAQQILAIAVQLDPTASLILNGTDATRDTLLATVPAAWLRGKEDVEKLAAANREQQEVTQQLEAAQQGADVVKTLGDASAAGRVA